MSKREMVQIVCLVGLTISAVALLLLVPSWFDSDGAGPLKPTAIAATLSVAFAGGLVWARFRVELLSPRIYDLKPPPSI